MTTIQRCVAASATMWLAAASAFADPIAGITYTYDLSQPDPHTGQMTTNHLLADDVDDMTNLAAATSFGRLADGELGSEVVTNPEVGCCLYSNGTYAGFRNDGAGGAPKVKIDIDLSGTFNLNSLTLHYLVNDRPAIYGPQPIRTASGDIQFNALTVFGSTDGASFTSLGFTNDFTPVFGPGGDFGTDAQEVRMATIDLAGSTATHLSVDIRTPWSFTFVSEVVVDGALVPGPGDFDVDGDVDGADFLIWQQGLGTTHDAADLDDWRANFGDGELPVLTTAVPEPAVAVMLAMGALAAFYRRPPTGHLYSSAISRHGRAA